MIGQCLLNKNESDTVSKCQKFFGSKQFRLKIFPWYGVRLLFWLIWAVRLSAPSKRPGCAKSFQMRAFCFLRVSIKNINWFLWISTLGVLCALARRESLHNGHEEPHCRLGLFHVFFFFFAPSTDPWTFAPNVWGPLGFRIIETYFYKERATLLNFS
jgi:hypothetical protein